MGGDFYDRDYSSQPNQVVGKQKTSLKACDPKNFTSGSSIVSNTANPIVIAFDVTGSMGDWTKVFYDKLPIFYGQLMMNSYLSDPSVSICAVGDIESDISPLQVTQFGSGVEIDKQMTSLWLQGGGGGNERESYDLAAYFYNNFATLPLSNLAFFFVTGDQGYYETPRTIKYNKFLNSRPLGQTVNSKEQWQKLMQSYNVFHLKKAYEQPDVQEKILQQWVHTLGRQRVIEVKPMKACVDIMLGLIAITNGSRTLESYLADMESRGQTAQRIQTVTQSLKPYCLALQTNKIVPVRMQSYISKFKSQFLPNYHKPAGQESQKLQKLKELFKGELPQSFFCPITGDIFMEPAMTCDGQTYERTAITYWLSDHDTSPLTNAKLQNKNLVQNYLIKKMINQFTERLR